MTGVDNNMMATFGLPGPDFTGIKFFVTKKNSTNISLVCVYRRKGEKSSICISCIACGHANSTCTGYRLSYSICVANVKY